MAGTQAAHSPEEIKKHVRGYIAVFVALALLTVITVFVAHIDFSKTGHVVAAMLIAAVKAGLVAAYFMHLVSERKVIYAALILTVVLFLVLMFLPITTTRDTFGV